MTQPAFEEDCTGSRLNERQIANVFLWDVDTLKPQRNVFSPIFESKGSREVFAFELFLFSSLPLF